MSEQFPIAGVYTFHEGATVNDVNNDPSLGFSALPKPGYSAGRHDKLRRLAFLLVALALVGTVFFYLTRAVQSSTAHATNDNSALHTDQ